MYNASSTLLLKSSPQVKQKLEQKLDFENYICLADLQAACLTVWQSYLLAYCLSGSLAGCIHDSLTCWTD